MATNNEDTKSSHVDEKVQSTHVLSMATTVAPLNTKASNLSQEWASWSIQFKIFLRASALDTQPNDRKVAILLHHLGPECLSIYNSFNMDIDKVKYEDLWKKLEDYFVPQVNIVMERHKFLTRRQKEHESISEFATDLLTLSKTCEFGEIREDMVRDIFISGMLPKLSHIKEKLLTKGNIKWANAFELAKGIELAKENASIMQQLNETDQNAVNYSVSHIQKYKVNKNNYNNICNKCGQVHRFKCPAEGKKCNICGKLNHFAEMCYWKKQNNTQMQFNKQQHQRPHRHQQHQKKIYVKNVVENETTDDSSDSESLFIGVLREDNDSTDSQDVLIGTVSEDERHKQWNIDVNINKKKVTCLIDTGAQANLLSSKTFKDLEISKVTYNSNNILTFSGEKIPVVGTTNVTVSYKGKKYSTKFYIVNMNCNNVIGLDLAVKMKLVKVCSTLEVQPTIEQILSKFDNVFDGLGLLKNKCSFKLIEDCQPVVDASRRVPFGLLEPLKKELKRMVEIEVIKEITEPTEWVNSIVLVTKPNGSLRICLDPKNLNKAIVRPRYAFPTIDECKSQLNGSKVFSSLDASSGFWMIPLEDASSKLCTFNTPFGRYRFLRLPFGINAAPEIFHSEMIRLFGDINNVLIYMDDFLIHAPDIKTHNEVLEKVLERAVSVGLKFNKSKSKILKKEIKFIGHIFSEDGVKVDEEKIKAIIDMPKPSNKTELQRFLGMVNYLGSFIKNLSAKTGKLRELLKNENIWCWGESQNEEFQKLKRIITNVPVLTYYNPNKAIILSVDASKFAVGAVIMHEKNPIAYASACLTEAQQNYSQIEKELFAIVFGCVRFHQYIYGLHITVETDHKPLIPIFKKPLYKIPARLQRLMLKLLTYNLTVVYKPGKDLFIADTLSRAPLASQYGQVLDKEIILHCNMITSQASCTNINLEKIKESQNKDPIFQKIRQYIKSDWPNNKKLVSPELGPYYSIKNELNEANGFLLKNDRLLIPQELRKEVLSHIHEGHMGIQNCQNLARSTVYWPNINNDIFNIVSSCDTCVKYRNANPKEPIIRHEIINIPWYKVGADLCEIDKRTYLIVVDYYSKFFEIEHLKGGYNTDQVVLKLKAIFSRHGIPAIFVSDNGPPFNSKDFSHFCWNWKIEHITSSPYIARSNGLAERTIQTIKKLIVKCKETGTDPYTAFLQYRTTSKHNMPSPAELLMSRKLRTKIPCTIKTLKPRTINSKIVKEQVRELNRKSNKYYNRTTRTLKPIKENEYVYFKKSPISVWYPGIIIEACKQPRSYLIKDENGTIYRRNRQQVLKNENKQVNQDNGQEINKDQIDYNKKAVVEDSIGNKIVTPNEYVTKGGRKVIPPKRLNYE